MPWNKILHKKIGDDIESATPELSEDFSRFNGFQTKADVNWPTSDITKVRVNVTNDNIDFIWNINDQNDAISNDLWQQGIFPSDTNWTLRFKIRFSTLTSDVDTLFWLALTDEDFNSPANNSQDGLAITFLHNNADKGYDIRSWDGAQPRLTGSGLAASRELTNPFLISTDYYVELKRTSSTTYEAQVYTDSLFTIPFGKKVRNTSPATIVNLRYIKLLSNDTTSPGNATGTIDDIQFFNNTEGIVESFVAHADEDLVTDIVLNDDFSTYGTPVTPDFTSDLTSTTGWTTTDATNVRVDTDLELLFYRAIRDTTNDQIAFDLGADVNPGPNIVDDDEWLLRFKFTVTELTTPTGNNLVCFVSLRSVDQTIGTEQSSDSLVFETVRTTGGSSLLRIREMDNQDYPSGDSTAFTTPLAIGTIYVQLIRVSATELEGRLYTDENYSDLIEKVTLTISSGVTSLRYLGVANLNSAVATGDYNVTIDDISFWDGRNTTCDENIETTVVTDDFSYGSQGAADAVWPSTDTARLDPFPNELTFSISPSQGDKIYRDLGTPLSDSGWTMRCKLDLQSFTASSPVGISLEIGMSDSNVDRTVNQDFIGLQMTVDSDGADQFFRGTDADGATVGSSVGTKFTNVPIIKTYYLEIERISSTQFKVSLYNDALFTSLLETKTETIPSTIIGLQFIKILLAKPSGSNLMAGVIDDIEIWDNNRISHKANWPTTFSDDMFVEPCQENICYTYSSILGPAGNRSIAFDLGSPLSDTKWVLRFKMFVGEISSDPNGPCFWFGFSESDESVSSNVAQNHIGLGIVQASGAKVYAGNNGTGIILVCSSTEPTNVTRTFVDGETIYWEIIRESASSLRITEFSDANYTFPVRTDRADMVTGGLGVNITGLRYLKLSNRTIGTLPLTNIGKWLLDDIKVWDGVDVADGIPGRSIQFVSTYGTHVIANTIQPEMSFNLDKENNYDYIVQTDGGADAKLSGQNHILVDNQSSPTSSVNAIINSTEGENPFITLHSVDSNTPGPANAPDRRDEIVAKWNITNKKVSRLLMNHDPGDAGDIATDGEIVVFSSD